MQDKQLEIIPLPVLKDNYVWMMVDRLKNQAVIVDPGEAEPVAAYLKTAKLNLLAILITHHHGDHTAGVKKLARIHHVPVFGSDRGSFAGTTKPLADGDPINIPDFPLPFTAMTIPGHTLDHLAYYTPGILFSGDTLFSAGCGRVFEGTIEQMYATLQKLAALPHATRIYCGHEYTLNNLRFAELVEPGNEEVQERKKWAEELRAQGKCTLPSTMQIEKQTNPFLRCGVPAVIEGAEKHAECNLDGEVEVFRVLRHWKNSF